MTSGSAGSLVIPPYSGRDSLWITGRILFSVLPEKASPAWNRVNLSMYGCLLQ